MDTFHAFLERTAGESVAGGGAECPAATYQPWVGSQYAVGGVSGLRVLVLGESHYFPESDKKFDGPDYTRQVVACWTQDQYPTFHPHSFFTKVAATLLQQNPISLSDRARLWDHIAFYNYIQESVGEKARDRPKPRQWIEARPAFLEAVRVLRPDVLLVLGKTLWRHLPEADRIAQGDTPAEDFRVYGSALAGHVTHPSGHASYDETMPIVKRLLSAARAHQGTSQQRAN